jgi:hypothetical protein
VQLPLFTPSALSFDDGFAGLRRTWLDEELE